MLSRTASCVILDQNLDAPSEAGPIDHVFAEISIACSLFALTNVDDFFVLVACFASPQFSGRDVVAGQALGLGLVTGGSMLLGFAAKSLRPEAIGLLGVIPLSLGFWKLAMLTRRTPAAACQDTAVKPANVLTIGALTVANGADNIGAYIPVFASKPPALLLTYGFTFALMTALWCIVAYKFARQSSLAAPARKYAHLLAPWIYIGLGLYILAASLRT